MMFLLALLVTASGFQAQIPSDEALRRTNAEIVGFTAEAVRSCRPPFVPHDWPATLDDSSTYWRSERPLLDWPHDVRRYVLDRLVDRSVKEPAIRTWLTSNGELETATMELSLTFQLTLRTSAWVESRAEMIVQQNSYQYDESATAKLLMSLNPDQRDYLWSHDMAIPFAKLSPPQGSLVKSILTAPPTVTPPPADRPVVVFDFYYHASLRSGKQQFSVDLGRSTIPVASREPDYPWRSTAKTRPMATRIRVAIR